jgi:hypothetical protein
MGRKLPFPRITLAAQYTALAVRTIGLRTTQIPMTIVFLLGNTAHGSDRRQQFFAAILSSKYLNSSAFSHTSNIAANVKDKGVSPMIFTAGSHPSLTKRGRGDLLPLMTQNLFCELLGQDTRFGGRVSILGSVVMDSLGIHHDNNIPPLSLIIHLQ